MRVGIVAAMKPEMEEILNEMEGKIIPDPKKL